MAQMNRNHHLDAECNSMAQMDVLGEPEDGRNYSRRTAASHTLAVSPSTIYGPFDIENNERLDFCFTLESLEDLQSRHVKINPAVMSSA